MSENYAKIKVSLENAETSKVKTCKHTDGQYGQSGLVYHRSSFLNLKQLGIEMNDQHFERLLPNFLRQ